MSRINVDIEAFTDPRFGQLAKLLGLADADHARSKVEYLWMACTLRGETELPAWLVEHHLGEIGPDALVSSELARWGAGRGDSNTRRLVIRGASKRTEWLREKQEQSSKGGKARAATASRADGRFTRTAGLPAGDAPPAETSAPAPAPAPAPASGKEPSPRAIHSTGTAPSTYTGAEPLERGRLAERFYAEVSAARVAMASELDQPAPLPFPPITPATRPQGYRDLLDRVREESAAAPEVCKRVLESAIADARVRRSIDWLDEKLFTAGGWRTARNRASAAPEQRPNGADPRRVYRDADGILHMPRPLPGEKEPPPDISDLARLREIRPGDPV
jgi:hypothetical protein